MRRKGFIIPRIVFLELYSFIVFLFLNGVYFFIAFQMKETKKKYYSNVNTAIRQSLLVSTVKEINNN